MGVGYTNQTPPKICGEGEGTGAEVSEADGGAAWVEVACGALHPRLHEKAMPTYAGSPGLPPEALSGQCTG